MIQGQETQVIRELWGTVSGEIDAERSRIVQNELEEAIRGIKIGMDNLSDSLIQSLMNSAQISRGSAVKRKDMTQLVVSCFAKPITHPKVGEIITDLLSGNNVYLYGRAGTGKTFMAENISETMLDLAFETLNCSQWTSPIQIIGGQTIEGYQQGALIKAWREGKVLVLDELPKLDPNTAGLLNDALAKSAAQLKPCYIYFDGTLKIGSEIKQGQTIINDEGQEVDDIRPVSGSKVFCINADDIQYWYFVEKGKLVRIETLKGNDPEPITKVPETIKSGQLAYFAPTVKDGKGDLSPKHPDFHCIATGNTDMKDTGGTAYGGNNRQDYSLIDRFSGSYYLIEYDTETERSLLYTRVYEISLMLREFLDNNDAIESISLRTMLNFNRIYEQEMLAMIGSKIALPLQREEVKTLKESVDSFIDAINPKSLGDKLRGETDIVPALDKTPDLGSFIAQFWNFHGEQDPVSGDIVDKEKIDKIIAKFS